MDPVILKHTLLHLLSRSVILFVASLLLHACGSMTPLYSPYCEELVEEPSWKGELLEFMLTDGDLNQLSKKTPCKSDKNTFSDGENFYRLKNRDKDLSNLIDPIQAPSTPQVFSEEKKNEDAPLQSTPSLLASAGEKSASTSIQPSPSKDLSRIEKLYNELDGKTKEKALQQYGYEIFQKPKPSFLMGPVDPNYVLGPEDEIVLRSVGGFEANQTLTVDRDGVIFIPKVGSIAVGYQPLSKAIDLIEKKIALQFQDFFLDITLGKLHSIKIFVTGYVNSPGIQIVPANSNIIDVLIAAGGINKNGTMRKITHKRNGEEDVEVDLYHLLLEGSLKAPWSLLPGDVLHIPPLGKTGAIIGPINSGIYELAEFVTVRDFLGYAGGENGFTLLETVLVERLMENGMRKLASLDYASQSDEVLVQDTDVIEFFSIPTDFNNSVFLTGAVVRPGVYPFTEGMRIEELLNQGGGFLLEASLEYALLERRLGQVSCYDQILGDASNNVQNQVKVIDLASLLAGDNTADITLKRLDKVKILTREEAHDDPQVSLLGAVRKPGTYKISSEMTLGDLIKIAGGPTADAYRGQSMIVRRAQSFDARQYEVELIPFELIDVLRGGKSSKILIRNLDQIVIKKIQTLNVKAEILGAVRFPGTYVLPRGSKIMDLLRIAGGFQDMADLRGAIFTRQSVKNLQLSGLDYLFAITWERFNRARDYLTKNGDLREGVAGQLSLLGLKGLESSMRSFQAQGRVVINMLKENFPVSPDNFPLADGDVLVIPEMNNSVVVSGEVFSPNAYVWCKNLTVRDYLSKAGWFQEYANPEQTFVLMANGEVLSAAQVGLDRFLTSRVGSGDIILVPPKELTRSKTAIVKDLLLDVIEILKGYSEFRLIDATVPQAGRRNAVINIDTNKDQPVYIPAGTSYDTVIQQQVNERRPE